MTLCYDDLLAPFQGSSEELLGTESEKFGVEVGSGRPVGYEGRCGILGFFAELRDRHGWAELREHPVGPVIALERVWHNGRVANVTLEPGAQLELSGAAVESAHEVARELDAHLAEIAPASESCGVAWLGTGYHPLATPAELPWVPKQRYAIMRDYFPTRGGRGLDMMRRTATVQVNVDYRDHEDAVRKMRVGLALSPVVTAIFASSPFAEGRPTGRKSERAAVWLDTDPDRTGLLPALWSEGATVRDYVEWALDVPMFLFKRDGRVVANTGQTFRSFWQDGFSGHRATHEDWLGHLATVFPEVRLKRTIELRSVDSLPRRLVPAVPALWAGIMYDDASLAAAAELTADWQHSEVQASRADVATRALGAELRGASIRGPAEEVLRIASEGLSRRARLDAEGRDERVYLAPVIELVERGRCPADVLLDRFDATASDHRHLVELTAI